MLSSETFDVTMGPLTEPGRGMGQFSSGIARGLTCSQVVEKGIIHKVSCHITSCIH